MKKSFTGALNLYVLTVQAYPLCKRMVNPTLTAKIKQRFLVIIFVLFSHMTVIMICLALETLPFQAPPQLSYSL